MKRFFNEYGAVVIIVIVIAILLVLVGSIQSADDGVKGTGLAAKVGQVYSDTIDKFKTALNLNNSNSGISSGGTTADVTTPDMTPSGEGITLVDASTFKRKIGYKTVETISFETSDPSKGTGTSYDVTSTQDKQIVAWKNGNDVVVKSQKKILLPRVAESYFSDYEMLKKISFANFSTEQTVNMERMFSSDVLLESLDLSRFDTSQVSSLLFFFSGCSNLKSINLKSFDTSNCYDFTGMFNNCSKLRTLNLSHLKNKENTPIDLALMFSDCTSLTDVDISGLKVSNARVNADRTFENCYNLITIYCNGFKSYSDTTNMFSNCSPKRNIDELGRPSQNGVFTTK